MQEDSPPHRAWVAVTASPRAIPEEGWEVAAGYDAFPVSLFLDEVSPEIGQEPQCVLPEN